MRGVPYIHSYLGEQRFIRLQVARAFLSQPLWFISTALSAFPVALATLKSLCLVEMPHKVRQK